PAYNRDSPANFGTPPPPCRKGTGPDCRAPDSWRSDGPVADRSFASFALAHRVPWSTSGKKVDSLESGIQRQEPIGVIEAWLDVYEICSSGRPNRSCWGDLRIFSATNSEMWITRPRVSQQIQPGDPSYKDLGNCGLRPAASLYGFPSARRSCVRWGESSTGLPCGV